MTQLMLSFESTALDFHSLTPEVSPVVVNTMTTPDQNKEDVPRFSELLKGDKNHPEEGPSSQEPHHMGDLARLVLMRYELVARRRALLAQNSVAG